MIGLSVAATAAFYLLVEQSQTDGIMGYYRDTLSAQSFAIWFAALVAATITPPVCGILFWRLSQRARRGWVVHLSTVPIIYLLFQALAALMLLAAGEPDLDSMTGHALLPAMLLLVITVIAYFSSVGVAAIAKRRRVGNGS
jgi:hypothetical protein